MYLFTYSQRGVIASVAKQSLPAQAGIKIATGCTVWYIPRDDKLLEKGE